MDLWLPARPDTRGPQACSSQLAATSYLASRQQVDPSDNSDEATRYPPLGGQQALPAQPNTPHHTTPQHTYPIPGPIGSPPPEGPSFVDEVINSSAFKSFIRSAATVAGREISRSMFGTGTRRRRRR